MVHVGLGQVLNVLWVVKLGQIFFEELSLVDAGGLDVVVVHLDGPWSSSCPKRRGRGSGHRISANHNVIARHVWS